MAKSKYLLVLVVFLSFCTTTNKMAKESFQYALFGQDEMTVYSRIGAPTRIFTETDGSKVLIYEFYSLEKVLLTDNISSEDYNFASFKSKSGTIYDIPFNPDFKIRENIEYQENITSLDVFMDEWGYCIGFDYNLPKERLKYYCDYLKAFVPQK